MNSRDAAAFLAENDEAMGDALPKGYTPLELLSDGPQSQTFLLKDDRTGELVVAKKCDAQLAETEARMLSRLSHPGLPALIGLQASAGGSFLIRSYAPGLPLTELLLGPLPESQALDILKQVLEILGYLHAQKPPVIHRDVKPANIVVDPETGRVSLIDLGIAREAGGNDADGDTRCMGTRAFAPPEQYGFMRTDPRADVYAAGAVLKWMLTDERAQSAGLKRLIRRMTAFDPKRRYPNARAALRALERYRSRTFARAALSAAAALAAVLFAAFGFWLGRYTDAPVAPMTAIFERDPAVEFSDPVLEARLRSRTGMADGLISTRAALGVQKLDLSAPAPDAKDSERITDITALSRFQNLRELDLSWNGIEDISALQSLTDLETLYLNGNGGITDFSPLQGLTNMKDLMLVSCQIFPDSAEIFRNMGSLASFWVESPRLTELDVVAYFPGLTKLVVKNCGICDLAPVLSLDNLRQIDVSGNPVSDLTPLLKLPHLAYATFSEAQRGLVESQLGDAAFDITYA